MFTYERAIKYSIASDNGHRSGANVSEDERNMYYSCDTNDPL